MCQSIPVDKPVINSIHALSGDGLINVSQVRHQLEFAGNVPLASQSPYRIKVYSEANYKLLLSHF